MDFNLESLVRENIKKMKPYSTARHEYKGQASVYLDANENAFGSPLPDRFNRYPDPLQKELKERISQVKGVPPQNIFIGNGSDEAIDLLFRIFCEPGKDNVLLFPPTYGMYEVCAELNNVEIIKLNLTKDFQLDLVNIKEKLTVFTKLIFICSPNNPTGNSINFADVESLLKTFNGIVVIDEAYINYAKQQSFISLLTEYPNLVIMQTFSKAWGLAGLRLGMAFASEPIIEYLNKVKYPYNINTATQWLVLDAMENINWVNEHINNTVIEREKLVENLKNLNGIKEVYPSEANFILVKTVNAGGVYRELCEAGIIVRDRSKVILCDDCLRITIGTPEENEVLITELKKIIAE